jgi:hypothetical protein
MLFDHDLKSPFFIFHLLRFFSPVIFTSFKVTGIFSSSPLVQEPGKTVRFTSLYATFINSAQVAY